jgi:hypothetical protein
MPLISPPQRPLCVAIEDDDRSRCWFRHWLLVRTDLMILARAWFISLGPVPGILALAVAKNILVALLAVGPGVNQQTAADDYTMLQQQPRSRD